jgi:NAD dependent epimerase/dehydratase family enzyme
MEDNKLQGTFNLTAPNPVTNAEFGSIAGKVLSRPSWFPVPGFALKMVLGEKTTLVLDGQQVVPQRLLESGYKFQFKNLDAALQDLQ